MSFSFNVFFYLSPMFSTFFQLWLVFMCFVNKVVVDVYGWGLAAASSLEDWKKVIVLNLMHTVINSCFLTALEKRIFILKLQP